MFTRCFERTTNRGYEVLNISEYGFEIYINNHLEKSGLVEPGTLDEIIQTLIEDEGWAEVE